MLVCVLVDVRDLVVVCVNTVFVLLIGDSCCSERGVLSRMLTPALSASFLSRRGE